MVANAAGVDISKIMIQVVFWYSNINVATYY